jgi:hypothetical protein
MPQTIELIPISTLMSDPANLRKHDARNIAAIKASLVEFGQVTPIVVDGKGIVRKGNGTLAAARELGWQTIQAVRTTLEGTRATAYAIADNRTTDLSSFSEVELAETLRALQSEDFGIEAAGFNEKELDALCEKLAQELGGPLEAPGQWKGMNEGQAVDDPGGEWQGMPAFESEDQKPFRSLHVHFRSEEDVRAFGRAIGQPIAEKENYLWFPPVEKVAWSESPYVDAA